MGIQDWGMEAQEEVSSTEMSHAVRIQRKRKVESAKETRVIVRGRVVAQGNIDRWEKRQLKRRKTGPAEDPGLAIVEDGNKSLVTHHGAI